MIDTQEQAKTWLTQLQFAAQKAKSIIEEIADGNQTLINITADLNPGLFPKEGKVDIVTMCDRYLSKKSDITRTDIMTAMSYVHLCGPALLMECVMTGVTVPDSPMEWFTHSKLPLM